MSTCFVIQPFDSGKFDKRFNDIYKPAIEAAGLEAYRVDQDPGVLVPIESIEKGIKQAALCLADITDNNPNVWYELGFAFASERTIVMVCSEERTGKKYPFDIQHRSIIPYMADSPSDFDRLRESLTEKIKAVLKQDAVLEKISESDPVVPIEGLAQTEIFVLAVLAGEIYLPGSSVHASLVKHEAERAGVTSMGFNLAIRKLSAKSFISEEQIFDDHGDGYPGLGISEAGWSWIEANESRFVLQRGDRKKGFDSVEIPF
jgi:hypothetical protein